MKFNPKNVNFLGLGSYPLPEVSFIKYVGVTIDNQLSWNEHIKITSKATSVKGFLQRNLSSCPIKVKLNSYKSLVQPILEYAPI